MKIGQETDFDKSGTEDAGGRPVPPRLPTRRYTLVRHALYDEGIERPHTPAEQPREYSGNGGRGEGWLLTLRELAEE